MSSSTKEMAVDVETFSSVDIDAGVYAYVEDPDFDRWCDRVIESLERSKESI